MDIRRIHEYALQREYEGGHGSGGGNRAQDSFVRRQALVISGTDSENSAADLILEEPLEIRLNGDPFAVVMRTPGHEVELAIGFSLTEGLLESYDDVLSVVFCPDTEEEAQANVVDVRLRTCAGAETHPGFTPLRARTRTIPSRSGCGLCGVQVLEDIEQWLAPLDPGPVIDVDEIVRLNRWMSEQQSLSRTTTGAHAAALAQIGGAPIMVREDVGRHNALDKLIGAAAIQKIDCAHCVVLLSSRVSFEMVQKAARARIPVVVGVSAATSLAVDLAGRLNCTLVGRLRGPNMVVHSHPERIRITTEVPADG
jgi:FdhD protein